MGWVVTRWRTDRLAALLDEDARASARRLLWEAERDAYRVRSAAALEARSAVTTLGEIEQVGAALRDGVRRFRAGEIKGSDPFVSRPGAKSPEQGSDPCAIVKGSDPSLGADGPRPDVLDPADADAPPPVPLRAARLEPAPARPARRPRAARASLRDSPLAEMMRAGAAR